MGKALYRTYRSKKLSEIVGQEHITAALARALKQGTVAHAYLFTGPRGVGKTSIARILAHEINHLPYDENEAQHLDIIEIDAASNRRIDEIRDLRDKVHIAPTSAKYKVYIIDEVHMLTREAFNALLKTLEEPPAHVVFILATTEVHKLPETIISRTQRYAFKPVEETKVVEHLKHIAKQEGIKIDDAALQLIALHGEGSFRDSISLLDQIRHAGTHITLQEVQTALGIAPLERIDSLLDALQNHDASAVVAQLQTLREGGFEPAQLARQLSEKLRSTLIQGEAALGQHEAMRLLARLVEVPASFDPHTSLEIALIDTALAGSSTSPIEPAEPKPHKTAAQTVHHTADDVQIEPHPSTFQKAQKKDEPANQKQPKATKPPKPEQNSTTAAEPDSRALTQEQWQQTLNTIKKKYNTLHSVLKASQAAFTPGTVRITCSNTFYKKRVSEARNKQIVCDTVQELFGLHVDMQCEQGTVALAETPPPLPPADGEIIRTVQPAEASAQPPQETTSEKPANESLKTINNIFGSSEVLES